ncbi:MAG: hypothetical protein H7839_15835 [Magnetococcus sp. YQC-5]
MLILKQLISLFSRFLYVLLALTVLGAMPYSGRMAWVAWKDYLAAQERLSVARIVRVSQDQQIEKIKDYKKFADEVHAFVKSARDNRLEEPVWTTYDVDIKTRLVTVGDLRTLMANAGPTSRYYFKPKRLEIIPLTAKEGVPKELERFAKGSKTGKEAAASKENVVKIHGQEQKVLGVGEQVILSLSGTFLVFPRS